MLFKMKIIYNPLRRKYFPKMEIQKAEKSVENFGTLLTSFFSFSRQHCHLLSHQNTSEKLTAIQPTKQTFHRANCPIHRHLAYTHTETVKCPYTAASASTRSCRLFITIHSTLNVSVIRGKRKRTYYKFSRQSRCCSRWSMIRQIHKYNIIIFP